MRQSLARGSGLGSGRGRRANGGDAQLQELLRRNWAEASEAGGARGGASREPPPDEEGVDLEETPDAANTFMVRPTLEPDTPSLSSACWHALPGRGGCASTVP